MRFRKKPVVVTAHQLDGLLTTVNKIIRWIEGSGGEAWKSYSGKEHDRCGSDGHRHGPWYCDGMRIRTLEGVMTAWKGDWIIRGVKGEFYPCKPDIFLATYDLLESPSQIIAVRGVKK